MEDLFTIKGEEEFQKGLEKLYSQESWNLRKALNHFCNAAQEGHVEATFQVGYLYLFGEPQIMRNAEKAVECFKIAAEKGLAVAKYHLAGCYLFGLVLEKDGEKAFELAKEAFEQGYMLSATLVCECYQHGIGVEKSIEKAREYNSYARQANIPIAELKFLELTMAK